MPKKSEKKLGAIPLKLTSVNKTGSWRAMVPVVDVKKCVKCGRCWMQCPEGAVKKTKKGFEINLEYCKGCGICAEECPVKAIVMVVEKK